MNYELAKELKDAGFPQHEPCDTCPRMDFCTPTLSELIEACGDGIRYLCRDNEGNWEAAEGALVGRQLLHHFSVACGTPEEAVAMLYLALNKPLSPTQPS